MARSDARELCTGSRTGSRVKGWILPLLLIVVVPGGGLIAIGIWWARRDRRSRVSAAWHTDQQRREWGTGVEQSSWKIWPWRA